MQSIFCLNDNLYIIKAYLNYNSYLRYELNYNEIIYNMFNLKLLKNGSALSFKNEIKF